MNTKILTGAIATALITTSFYLNKGTQPKQQTYNPSEIVGSYSALMKTKYKATEIAEGDVKDIVIIDSNLTISVSKKGKLYELFIDDNNPKTPQKPKCLGITDLKCDKTDIGLQIPKQQFDPDSIKPITIVGIKSFKNSSGLFAGIYNRKTKKLSFKFGGNFYKSLDGSADAIVSMPTEIEISATKK